MRLLVCGSRYWDDPTIMRTLSTMLTDHDVLIQGGARGADQMFRSVAAWTGCLIWTYEADWEKHGRAAGPIRNQQMLDDGKPDLVLAFVNKPLAESRGTADMVRRARQAGVPVYVIEAM